MHKPDFIYSIINSAIDCISSGNIVRAKSLLRAAAKNLPNNSEINRLMGVAEAISGDQVMALDFFNRSIKFDSKNSNAYSNRGNIYCDMGDISAAIDDYFAAIKIDPKNFEAFYMRGLAYEKLDQIELAIQDYSKAISINPEYIDAYLNTVALLIAGRRLHDALSYLKILAERHPGIFDVWLNMGYVFIELKEFNLAMECHEKALAINPNDSRALVNMGITFEKIGLLDNALTCYEALVEMNPGDPKAHSYRGYILYRKKNYSDALTCFKFALSMDPNLVDAWCNMGMTFVELKRFDEAKQALIKAIECDPNHAESHLSFGQLLLGLFEFNDGWDEYDWRWKSSVSDTEYLASCKPLWQGQNSIGHLFVWSEQGIGDQILFATLLPELKLHAESITVSTDRKLIPLFERAYPEIRFIDKKTPLSSENFDYQIPIASLPKILRPNLDSFLTAKRNHLMVNPSLLENIHLLTSEKISATKKKCGLSWFSGNQKLGGDKSIPLLEFAPILNLKEYEFVDLQYGETEMDRKSAFNLTGTQIHKFSQIDNYDDLESLLGLINTCDIVVTVSNTTAHLTAGLGKEVILLLPFSSGKFWYWNGYQGKNLWYSNVITFDQEKQGSWATPIQKVKEYMQSKAS